MGAVAVKDEEAKALGAPVAKGIVPRAAKPPETCRMSHVTSASSSATWQGIAQIRRMKGPPGAAPEELVRIRPSPEPPPAENGAGKEEEKAAKRVLEESRRARRTRLPATLLSPKRESA